MIVRCVHAYRMRLVALHMKACCHRLSPALHTQASLKPHSWRCADACFCSNSPYPLTHACPSVYVFTYLSTWHLLVPSS
jgi:hypothetical protein